MYYIVALLLKGGLRLLGPFVPGVRRLLSGQRGVFDQLQRFATQRDAASDCLWFHCASLGEFEQGRPLIEAFSAKYPDVLIVLTFFSPSGYEVRRDYPVADLVSYLPLDGKRSSQRFVRLVRPTAAFFVKYEYWYGYLQALRQRGTPTYSVSTQITERAVPFRWYGGFYRRMMRWITHYFPQDQATVNLLGQIDISPVTLAGDTRFDRAAALCQTAPDVPLVERFKGHALVWVVGSSWPPDTDVLLPLLREFYQEVKFLVAPHQITEDALRRWETAVPGGAVRYSQADPSSVADYRVLLIDNVGMLTSLYRYGSFAYVGGAFGQGLHNVLEPATFGMPIYFGDRRYQHVNEANELMARGGAFAIANSAALRQQFLAHYQDEALRADIAKTTQQFVVEHTGATQTIMQHVEKEMGWKEL